LYSMVTPVRKSLVEIMQDCKRSMVREVTDSSQDKAVATSRQCKILTPSNYNRL
jgi:hypothetical protein